MDQKAIFPRLFNTAKYTLTVYNIGFGDKDTLNGNVDDMVVTNNGDSKKVLATVAFTVYEFTGKHPDAWVYATGSRESRTRLYLIGINNFFDEISADFDIYMALIMGRLSNLKAVLSTKVFLLSEKINKFVT